jgi:hypothetical protein
MGVQFEQVTLSPHRSLSFLVDDMARARRASAVHGPSDWSGLEDWLNVLQSWSAPLIQSESGRRGIEQWLDAVAADDSSAA